MSNAARAARQREAVAQHLDARLVLQRLLDQVDDRQRAVQAVVAAVLDQDAAHRDVVAGRAVQLRARDAAGVPQRVVEPLRGLRVEYVARDHVDRQRRVEQPGVAERAGLDQVGAERVQAVGRDDDGLEHGGVGRLGARHGGTGRGGRGAASSRAAAAVGRQGSRAVIGRLRAGRRDRTSPDANDSHQKNAISSCIERVAGLSACTSDDQLPNK
jgi:hypothetical protein